MLLRYRLYLSTLLESRYIFKKKKKILVAITVEVSLGTLIGPTHTTDVVVSPSRTANYTQALCRAGVLRWTLAQMCRLLTVLSFRASLSRGVVAPGRAARKVPFRATSSQQPCTSGTTSYSTRDKMLPQYQPGGQDARIVTTWYSNRR